MSVLTVRPWVLFGALVATIATLGAGPAASATEWQDSSKVCQVQDTRITENSGMSRSTYRRRALFVHNDSGDKARFFAVGPLGCRTRAVFRLRTHARDWEDMASGPRHTLWLGDIGGNRAEVSTFVVKEPWKLASRRLDFTEYKLVYPDGPHNAESLMVHPTTGQLYLVTKAKTGAGIYAAPAVLDPDGPNHLVRVADAPGQDLTGADFSPDGMHIVIRAYRAVFLYSAITDTPVRISVPEAHTFGEAVTFDREGDLVLGAEGVQQWLWEMQ